MTNSPETIAVFRIHETQLDAELERSLGFFSSRDIHIKQLCCREYSATGSYTCVALEWGISAEKQWVTKVGASFVSAHFYFQEPPDIHAPLFLHCNVQAGRVDNGEKSVVISKEHGGSINLIFETGLGNYIAERMSEVISELG